MSYAVLQQAVDAMRSGPIPKKHLLVKIREYATRHQQDLDTLKRLGQNKTTPESIQKIGQSALQTLQKLTDQYLTLVDCRVFFSDKEMASAARDLVAPQHLQAMLDQINALSSVKEVTNSVPAITAKLKRLKFPLDRYMTARFRLPE
jgi:hypothetical protein